MNKSIRVTALFSILLTIILLINLTVVQAFSVDKYAKNEHNQRGFYDMQTIARGQIFAGGAVLAESTPNEDDTYSRSYPVDSPAWGPVTGYLSSQYGASQLEASYNDILNGTDDSLLTTNFMDLITGEQPDGANVEVTIDPQLQQLAYDQLNQQGYEGAAVALQPSTGKILAMASSPSYNPNNIDEQWGQLQEQEGNPLLNHATQETLPPGSIFKIITTAAGLDNGYSPDSTLTGASEITLPGTETQLTNYGGQVCGGSQQVSLTTAFSLSCNTAFVEMGMDVGADELRSYAEGFGVGQSADIGVETASGSLGDLPDDAAVGQSSIGQRDVSMSALQAAGMAATVANNGVRMEPYLVNRITDSTMNDIRTTDPKEASTAVSEELAATLTDLMYESERNTSGYNGNSYASKTGTAEHGADLPPHVWYVAFDPDRDIAVAVVVKNGGNLGQSATGGQVSAPIGRAILDGYGGGQ
ncbi:penicillin-binding transpeptidase domain-containing protein [Corynebacterium casei]|uniref:penicillin-binding transpeptidase domain-containing protein n=1 Tax=Corynebacterium casei TaxID=160386 RepID=UPI000ED75CED|nr:penicillin-binding protein 2 [Corynebacterium casei]HCJ68360.1 penicillin-binding protein [Corynebacterium casei]